VTVVLPPLVPLDQELVEASARAHAELFEALDAVDAVTRHLFKVVQHRFLVEAAATTKPIWSTANAPEIVARRRLLSPAVADRVAGVTDALRYFDTRETMLRMGLLDHVVARETPCVVNAFVEGRSPTGRETNAGSVRVTPSGFLDPENRFTPPSAEYCVDMLETAIDVVHSAPIAPITSAGWLTLAVFAIHPFVDGNGRTARLLFQAVHSSSMEGGIDWGSLEAWALERRRYLTAIQASANAAAGKGIDHIDPLPFLRFTAHRSIEGAERSIRRLRQLAAALDRLRERGLDDEAALIAAFVWSERNVRSDELRELPIDASRARALANELVRSGVLIRSERRGLNPAVPVDSL
jgi:Fic/DOC family